VASVAAPAPAAPVPFTAQLARPIFSLAAAGAGEHVMTVSVTPDNLGPVTVRAHVGAEGVRVELFAPNDLGREAIRAIIPDLRRDLAGAGLGSNLSLSSQNQPTTDGSSHGSATGQPGERATERGNSTGNGSAIDENAEPTSEQAVDRTGRFGTISTIDVLA
jgi:flagellar hook-length control protein FliK